MFTRRSFLKSAALITASSMAHPTTLFSQRSNTRISTMQRRMQLSYSPFEAQLKHPFTVSGYTRTTTPIVLTQLTYEGVTGYGEAAMPPI